MTKSVVRNFFSLTFIQATNFLLPLILIPFIIRVVGVEKFGVITFVQAFSVILTTIVDYGFNLTATREISIYRNNGPELSRIFSSVLWTKMLLFVGALILAVVVAFAVPQYRPIALPMLGGLTIVFGNAIFPVWFFLGMERTRELAVLNLAGKSLCAILIVTLIKEQSQFILVILFFGIGSILVGALALCLIYFKMRIQIVKPEREEIKKQLVENKEFFLSNIAIASVLNMNLPILNLISTNRTVIGDFSVAERITYACWQVISAFSQSIYPHLCQLTKEPNGFGLIKTFYRKFYVPFQVVLIGGVAVLFFLSEQIVFVVTGEWNHEIATLLRIMCPSLVLIGFNLPANLIYLAYDLKKSYTTIFVSTAIFNIILSTALGIYWNGTGIAIGMVITHFFLTLVLHIHLKKYPALFLFQR